MIGTLIALGALLTGGGFGIWDSLVVIVSTVAGVALYTALKPRDGNIDEETTFPAPPVGFVDALKKRIHSMDDPWARVTQ